MSGNLKEVRERIKSVRSTQQITKAMKMVSAAKLRKAQDAITKIRPYSNKLNDMLINILSNLDGNADVSLGVEREVKRVAIVVVTSSRGLCGAFNANICKLAMQTIQEKYQSQLRNNDLRVYCIGRKGYDYFRKRLDNKMVINRYVNLFEDLSFDNVSNVPKLLIRHFEDKSFDRVEVAYGRFKNAAMQFAEISQFLPVPKFEQPEDEKTMRADYIFEPDTNSLLEHLVPSILQTTFQRYLLDTHASEHGARMTAMDKATENAEELMKELKITYNKARQEAITKEISEIVGGAAALEGA